MDSTQSGTGGPAEEPPFVAPEHVHNTSIGLVQILILTVVVAVLFWIYNQNNKKRKRENVPTQRVDDTVVEANKDEVRQRRLQRFHVDNSNENITNSNTNDNTVSVQKQHEGPAENQRTQHVSIANKVDNVKIAQQAENRRTQEPVQQKPPEPKPPVIQTPPKPQITPEIVASSIIEKVLKVSTKESSASKDYFYLTMLSQELSPSFEGKDQILLAEKDVYDAIDERMKTLKPGLESLTYLYNCFVSASTEQRKTTGHESLFATLQRCIVAHFGLALQSSPLDLFSLLESKPVPNELLQSVISQFENDTNDAFVQNIFEVRKKLQQMTLMDNLSPTLSVLSQLTSNPHIVKLMTQLANWKTFNANNGREIQNNSVLGPLFHFTTFYEQAPSLGNHHFDKPSQLTLPQVESSMSTLRTQLNGVQAMVYESIRNILKCERDSMIEWLSLVVISNLARSKMQFNPHSTSTDGFLINVGAVCVRLCSFANVSKPKFDQLDSRYCVINSRLPYDGITRISMSNDELSQWQKDNKDALPSNGYPLATEMFFITHYLLHVGYIKTISNYHDFIQQIARMQAKKKELKATQLQWSQSPQAPMMEMALKRLDEQLQLLYKHKLCQDTQLMDPQLITNTLNFYAFTGQWLLHLVDPQSKGLPLNEKIPPQFGALPEYIFQDMAEFLLFLLRFNKDKIDIYLLDIISNFLITFIGTVDYIKNPYLRSKLAEVIYEMFPHEDESNNNNNTTLVATSRFNSIFEQNAVALESLVPALIRLYVDIEQTGRHGQFYEKFFVRRHIAGLLKHLRSFPVYCDAIKTLAKRDLKMFIKFVNMMINDSVYLLDEVLGKLPEIKDLEALMDDKDRWLALSETARQEKQEALANASRMVPTFSMLANETVLLFNFLSQNVKEPFLSPELVERIAQMINYFVFHLAGPKSLELKVKDPQRFHFDPRFLLGKLVEIYLHFCDDENFMNAVVQDARSFKLEVLHKVSSVLRRSNLLPEELVLAFEQFTMRAEKMAVTIQTTEEELGEIPDEFLDPISCALMEDPVILPTSGHTVDRTVIARHLLSDSKDPFNRAPLTIEMVQPNTELKAKIAEWKASKKKS